jgi:hypothetical protein
MLLAAHRKDIVGELYRHPRFLTASGYVMVAFTAWMGWQSLSKIVDLIR